MSENLKTIKELADELGVSKNKIHYQVSKISSEYVVRNLISSLIEFFTHVSGHHLHAVMEIPLET